MIWNIKGNKKKPLKKTKMLMDNRKFSLMKMPFWKKFYRAQWSRAKILLMTKTNTLVSNTLVTNTLVTNTPT